MHRPHSPLPAEAFGAALVSLGHGRMLAGVLLALARAVGSAWAGMRAGARMQRKAVRTERLLAELSPHIRCDIGWSAASHPADPGDNAERPR